MNGVEIERAITDLAARGFDADEFPFRFLAAFGNKDTTIKRLRSGGTNASDMGGVLQRRHIHIKVAAPGTVTATLQALHDSPATAKARARFILATDGQTLEAEDLAEGTTIACDYADFPDHFGFFLALAGISIDARIRDNPFDIRATSRLNRLYLQILKDNPDWGTQARQHAMNHFMARLIFCFFAEDTDIFGATGLFTKTVEEMSAGGGDTAQVIATLFAAMNRKGSARDDLPGWACKFPYVNGGLFSGSLDVPHFTRMARSYLLHIGHLDWTKINPDIFGSMTQAIASEDERGNLGMHYTSVPNILKVLNPLFLDDLRAQLAAAEDNPRKLLNLKKRMARIRVFDPACGSGNFLVIAYKEMRKIEAEANRRRGEDDAKSLIPKTNFRGLEISDFSAEIARLALIIAEYQCDELYRGQRQALAEFLPLDAENWITQGNALRLDWLSVCPPTGAAVKLRGDDLFQTPLEQAEIDFENEGGETYICGNPPYLGSTWQSKAQKDDLKQIFAGRIRNWKSLDYVAGWFLKAADYARHTPCATAFVATNSICQGQQVPILWPEIFAAGQQIAFAHHSFKWANLASHKAGVTVVIVGLAHDPGPVRLLFELDDEGRTLRREVEQINAYLVPGAEVIVERANRPLCRQAEMNFGNKPVDGGNLLLSGAEVEALGLNAAQRARFIRRIYGSAEFIRGVVRYCLWIADEHLAEAMAIPAIARRIEGVRQMRLNSRDKGANAMAERAHQMREMNIGERQSIVMPRTSSESRPFLPAGLVDANSTVTSEAFALYDAPLWNLALIASRLHLVWIATVCGKLKTDFRYSNTMGWNTFPIPKLTAQNRTDLTRAAENILLAREAHFPATIAGLYQPGQMPENLARAHAENDTIIERIYIGRTFKNDTERLEKLFEMYQELVRNGGKTDPSKREDSG